MRMAKLRRTYERKLEGARDTWRADQARRAAMEAEKAETIKKVTAIRDSHASTLRPDPYGRHGSQRAICVYCTTNVFPCPTWKSLNGLLDRLLGRAV